MRVLNISLLIVCIDQISKLIVKGINIPSLGIQIGGVPLGSSYMIIGDFLRLTYIENAGMAFGIDVGGRLFFSLFSIVAIVVILVYLYKIREEKFLLRLPLALIIAGAVGNLIDRMFYGIIFNEGPLFYGKVVDFIDADFFDINILGYHLTRWPIFNVADASVTCGILLLLFTHNRFTKGKKQVEEISDTTQSTNIRDSENILTLKVSLTNNF